MKLIAPYFESYLGQKEEQDLLAGVLTAEGIEYHPWQATEGDIPRGDALFWQGISSYHHRMDRFEELLSQADRREMVSFNSVTLLRWNSHKTYLKELEQKGIVGLDTLWMDSYDSGIITRWARERDYAEIVVKPVVSAGAHLTFRTKSESLIEVTEAYAEHPHRPVMVQPFAPEILTAGEWSFIFFGGELSHAVRKTPKAGDYRIQHVHGGSYVREQPEAAVLNQAQQEVMAALPEQPLYARVDGILREGKLLLMEVELIEPYFYLDAAPERASLFVQKVVQALGKNRKAA